MGPRAFQAGCPGGGGPTPSHIIGPSGPHMRGPNPAQTKERHGHQTLRLFTRRSFQRHDQGVYHYD